MLIITKFDLHQEVWRVVGIAVPTADPTLVVPTKVFMKVHPFAATVTGFVVQGNKRILYKLSDQYVAKEHELFASREEAQEMCNNLNQVAP